MTVIQGSEIPYKPWIICLVKLEFSFLVTLLIRVSESHYEEGTCT